MKEEEQQREATIKLLEKGKRLKDRQLKQAQQCADQATEALAEAVRRSTQLAQLVGCPELWHICPCPCLAMLQSGCQAFDCAVWWCSLRRCCLLLSELRTVK